MLQGWGGGKNTGSKGRFAEAQKTATRGEGVGMQGQGAGISGLTMVSAQRWGTGEGSRGSPFSLRRKMSITEPRPHSPASRWFPEAASGPERRIPGCKEVLLLVRGREEALTTTGAPVGRGRAEAHTAPGESSARSPVPRIPAPPPPRANPPAPGRGVGTCSAAPPLSPSLARGAPGRVRARRCAPCRLGEGVACLSASSVSTQESVSECVNDIERLFLLAT